MAFLRPIPASQANPVNSPLRRGELRHQSVNFPPPCLFFKNLAPRNGVARPDLFLDYLSLPSRLSPWGWGLLLGLPLLLVGWRLVLLRPPPLTPFRTALVTLKRRTYSFVRSLGAALLDRELPAFPLTMRRWEMVPERHRPWILLVWARTNTFVGLGHIAMSLTASWTRRNPDMRIYLPTLALYFVSLECLRLIVHFETLLAHVRSVQVNGPPTFWNEPQNEFSTMRMRRTCARLSSSVLSTTGRTN